MNPIGLVKTESAVISFAAANEEREALLFFAAIEDCDWFHRNKDRQYRIRPAKNVEVSGLTAFERAKLLSEAPLRLRAGGKPIEPKFVIIRRPEDGQAPGRPILVASYHSAGVALWVLKSDGWVQDYIDRYWSGPSEQAYLKDELEIVRERQRGADHRRPGYVGPRLRPSWLTPLPQWSSHNRVRCRSPGWLKHHLRRCRRRFHRGW